MTEGLILHRDHLVPLLRWLGRDHRLVGPVANQHGDTLYAEIPDLDRVEIDLDHQPQNSLKHFFFPQRETLASYIVDQDPDTGGRAMSFHPELPPERPTVFFGVRSCDLFAVLYMDTIFLGPRFRDPYYEQRRRGALFISLGCNNPFAHCFCNGTNNGPFLEFGFDLQLTLLDDGRHFFVETGKAGGRRLVNRFSSFFRPATDGERNLQYQAALEARSLFQQLVPVDLACALLRDGTEPETIIAELSRRCQDCGGCAYVCPTCTCFTINDEKQDSESGERVRAWDACTFAGFTRMAGGHNPVDPERQRIRRRFLHKLKSDVARHGRPSCVGCGRCVDICFGGVDIVRFINMVTEAADPEQQS